MVKNYNCFRFLCWIILSHFVKYGSSQCFAAPEISTSYGSHEMINFESDIGKLAAKIALDIIENSANMPNCDERNNYCTASLGTCIDSGSLVHSI